MEGSNNLLLNPSMFPWLMFFSSEDDKKSNDSKRLENEEANEETAKSSQIFYSISKREKHITHTREMKYGQCIESPQGWLLIHDPNSSNCSLLNPATMHRLHLPPLKLEYETMHKRYKLILSSSPIDQDCAVMLHDIHDGRLIHCELGSLNHASKWKFDGYLDRLEKEETIYSLAASGKQFYGITTANNAVAIQLTPFFRIDPVKVKNSADIVGIYGCRYEGLLVGTCRELFLVQRFWTLGWEKMVDIRVFKLDMTENEKWIRLGSIGDRVFMLQGDIGGTCLGKEVGLKGGCIYSFQFEGSRMEVFDFLEGTLQFKRLPLEFSLPPLLIFPPL